MRFVGVDLPLGPVLVNSGYPYVRSGAGHVREVSQRRTAEEKGFTLLKQWLSPAQLAQYEKYGYFEVMGGDSGKRYRIRPTRQMNVDELDRTRRADRRMVLRPRRGTSNR